MAPTSEDDPGRPGVGVDPAPVGLLESICRSGRVWSDLAVQYGVTNPDPPWRIALDATCDILAAESCAKPNVRADAGPGVLPALERRAEEDDLSATVYADVPFPERQLLALAHSMIRRGLFDEAELARRMKQVQERLTAT
ncbi:MAG TPA: hypothetical protein VNE59_09505 [Burkholderiales bacterium]|nr:hypothetical protein [Burkholderiales bacterium]